MSQTSNNTEHQSSGWVIASFVMSAVSLVFLPILFGPLAIAFAAVGIGKNQRHSGWALGVAPLAMIIGFFLGLLIVMRY